MVLSMVWNVGGVLDIFRLILKFLVMFNFVIMLLRFFLVMLIVWVIFILCVSLRWYLLILVIIILCVLMCFVIVVVIILIGFVLEISIFLFIRLNDSVVCMVLLKGLKIVVKLLEILLGILKVLNVGIIRYLVK